MPPIFLIYRLYAPLEEGKHIRKGRCLGMYSSTAKIMVSGQAKPTYANGLAFTTQPLNEPSESITFNP
ncbi:MAG: hypothetical protein AAF655_21385 [Bacteroidota bacterium]